MLQAASIRLPQAVCVNNNDEMLNDVAGTQENSGLPAPPDRLLADGSMTAGDNINECSEQGIELYAPIKTTDPSTNLAVWTALGA